MEKSKRPTMIDVAKASGVSHQTVSRVINQDAKVAPETREYGLRLADAARARGAEIDRLIGECADRWDVDRLAVVDRIILRMSIAELMTQPDVPAKVCINEAVEIARKFSTEHSSRFVNGVLDAVARRLQAPPGA